MSSMIEEIKDLDLDPYSMYLDEGTINDFKILEKLEKLLISKQSSKLSNLEFKGFVDKEVAECFEPTEIEVRLGNDKYPVVVNGVTLRFEDIGDCLILISDDYGIRVRLALDGSMYTVYVTTDIEMFNTHFVMKVLKFSGRYLERVTYWSEYGPAVIVYYDGTKIDSIQVIDKKILRSRFNSDCSLLGYYEGDKLYTYIQPPIVLEARYVVKHKEVALEKLVNGFTEAMEKRWYL